MNDATYFSLGLIIVLVGFIISALTAPYVGVCFEAGALFPIAKITGAL